MTDNYDKDLLEFIKKYPTAYHSTLGQADILEDNGFVRLREEDRWNLELGGAYYIIRNDASLIAFRIPDDSCMTGTGAEDRIPLFRIAASHSDSPVFKLKTIPESVKGKEYTTLNVEMYGGTISSAWLDRPLTIAGRVMVKNGRNENPSYKSTCVILKSQVLIPNLAIHMNRDVNKGVELNVQNHLQPLWCMGSGDSTTTVRAVVAKELGIGEEEILGMDLFLVNVQEPCIWGQKNEFMSSPRLDNQQCAYSSLMAMTETKAVEGIIPVHAVFDNEETGSSTRQGAASGFLKDTLRRISIYLGLGEEEHMRALALSMMLSADNAHGLHPNYMNVSDDVNRPLPGGGVVLKHSANCKYTTDAASEAAVMILADRAGIRLQHFSNRSDMPGGSTLGNISSSQVSIATADIGIAQWAMHSPYETCGCGDTGEMIRLMKEFLVSRL